MACLSTPWAFFVPMESFALFSLCGISPDLFPFSISYWESLLFVHPIDGIFTLDDILLSDKPLSQLFTFCKKSHNAALPRCPLTSRDGGQGRWSSRLRSSTGNHLFANAAGVNLIRVAKFRAQKNGENSKQNFVPNVSHLVASSWNS